MPTIFSKIEEELAPGKLESAVLFGLSVLSDLVSPKRVDPAPEDKLAKLEVSEVEVLTAQTAPSLEALRKVFERYGAFELKPMENWPEDHQIIVVNTAQFHDSSLGHLAFAFPSQQDLDQVAVAFIVETGCSFSYTHSSPD